MYILHKKFTNTLALKKQACKLHKWKKACKYFAEKSAAGDGEA